MKTSSPETARGPVAAIRSAAATVWAPSAAPAGSVQRRIHLARQAVLVAATLITLVEVIVWLIIAIVTGDLDAPWWLWSAAAGVVGALALTAAAKLHDQWAGQD